MVKNVILFSKQNNMYWIPNLGDKSQIDILVQDCSNSIANAMEWLQTCTKPLYNYSVL